MSLLPPTGPAEDLYIVYHQLPLKALPDPTGIPFHIQAQPIFMDQPHTTQEQVDQATRYETTNPLPYDHFVGVGLTGEPAPPQINQPDFLSVNDDMLWV